MQKKFLLLAGLFLSLYGSANISLPRIFGDNMVLQRDRPIPVWGWAAPHEGLAVTFNGKTQAVKADAKGNWSCALPSLPAGGPYQLLVKGKKNQVLIDNILIGEVWICSGQSNMEMPIEGWGKVNNYEAEIAAANYPQIRHLKVPNTVSTTPRQDIGACAWNICNPANAGEFTATGYFFARALFNELKVPIGLINSSWGGTHSETWTSREALAQNEEFRNLLGSIREVNLDSIARENQKKLMVAVNAFQDNLSTEGVDHWRQADFDDSKWSELQVPGLWEEQGLPGLDGVVWMRKAVEVGAADAGKEAELSVAKIDDNDDTYVNGVKVGSTNSWDAERHYRIPAGVLVAGKNMIAVRVVDNGGGGGIYGDPSGLFVKVNGHSLPLNGKWRARIESILKAQTSGMGPNSFPTLLFNGMINPLIPFGFKGVIWYQGEANAGRAYQYRKAFPMLIRDWRQHWKAGDFPFLFVQLASFNADNGNSTSGSTWAELREAQSMTLSLPNTGMAVTTDIGNATDIHPKNKQEVGKRLAAIALATVYGVKSEYMGPQYLSLAKENGRITLTFSHTGSGLWAKDKYGYLKGFEIAGADQKFHYAKALVQGNQVVVFQEGMTDPVAVRYGWADDAGEANLYNKEGFPASPFRTDQWKGITEGNKFIIGQ